MSTLIAYWKVTTKQRWLKGLAGIAACLAPLVCLALNPSAAIRVVEWGLSRKRSNRHAASASDSQASATANTGSLEQASGTLPRVLERTATPSLNSGVLHPAIAASIGAPQISGRVADGSLQTPATGRFDERNLGILERVCEILKSGRVTFGQTPAYSATFIKRERIGSDVTDLTTIEIKVRHQPFAVYLKWLEGPGAGKEVLYVDGENDGSMLVRLGGVKGRLIPAFKLDVTGALAMNQSRYPVTKAGILGLADSLIAHREMELRNQVHARARQEPDALCDGRTCAVYVFEFDDKERSPDYRKSIQYLDRRWNVPLQVENYGWPEPGQHLEGAALDEATLIEYYKYSNIVADGRLNDDDFSPSNPEYRFRR
jgi:Protein of unknown function (DUF1571)